MNLELEEIRKRFVDIESRLDVYERKRGKLYELVEEYIMKTEFLIDEMNRITTHNLRKELDKNERRK